MCVDFKDLNKASPKYDFPLPHIDILVDNITGHALLSFMDGFFRIQSNKDGSKRYGENLLHYSMGDVLLQGHAIWP